MVHFISGWTWGVQVKLWDPLRTHGIPEHLRGVFTTRRYTNPSLPLPLPLVTCGLRISSGICADSEHGSTVPCLTSPSSYYTSDGCYYRKVEEAMLALWQMQPMLSYGLRLKRFVYTLLFIVFIYKNSEIVITGLFCEVDWLVTIIFYAAFPFGYNYLSVLFFLCLLLLDARRSSMIVFHKTVS